MNRQELLTEEAICQVCFHHCRLKPGQRGICHARKNEAGKIIGENYGWVTSMALDPIEKKPLGFFNPGSLILSVGSYGCNLRCPFCQNYEISMAAPEEAGAVFLSPKELAARVSSLRMVGNIGVAFTYNEPLIGWEYVLDGARLVKNAGMKTVLVTNGTASLEVLEPLLPFIDAMNIDLKGFQESYYQKLGGSLEMVKRFIARAALDCHVELTTLIVPGENDQVSDMEEEAKWIASVSRAIPLHVTRFFPRYQMKEKKATDVAKLYALAEAASGYLEHVMVGNC